MSFPVMCSRKGCRRIGIAGPLVVPRDILCRVLRMVQSLWDAVGDALSLS